MGCDHSVGYWHREPCEIILYSDMDRALQFAVLDFHARVKDGIQDKRELNRRLLESPILHLKRIARIHNYCPECGVRLELPA